MNLNDKKGNVYQCSDGILRCTPRDLFDMMDHIDEIAVVQEPLEGMLINCLTKNDLFHLSYDKIKPGDLSRDVIYYDRKEDGVKHLDRFYGFMYANDPDLIVHTPDEFIGNAIKSRAERLGVNIMYFPSRLIIREKDDDKELISRIIGAE